MQTLPSKNPEGKAPLPPGVPRGGVFGTCFSMSDANEVGHERAKGTPSYAWPSGGHRLIMIMPDMSLEGVSRFSVSIGLDLCFPISPVQVCQYQKVATSLRPRIHS
jgi:hypothetical protein